MSTSVTQTQPPPPPTHPPRRSEPTEADSSGDGPQAQSTSLVKSNRHTPQAEHGWRLRLMRWLERHLAERSARSHFWHRLCSWLFLPLAYRSGIKIKHVTQDSFSVVLPFRRFNKNWYRAMAGAALLGNSEVAGGMFVFGKVGSKYTVVCRNMNYRFLRPCFGPAIYQIEPHEDIEAKVETGEEFNVTLDMKVVQAVHKKEERERRVGQCEITFHVTPKTQHRARRQRQANLEERSGE